MNNFKIGIIIGDKFKHKGLYQVKYIRNNKMTEDSFRINELELIK